MICDLRLHLSTLLKKREGSGWNEAFRRDSTKTLVALNRPPSLT